MTAPANSPAKTAADAAPAAATTPTAASNGAYSEGLPPLQPRPSPLVTRKEFPRIALAWIAGLIVVGMAVGFGALAVLNVQKAREQERMAQSTNNLKGIGMAFLGFHGMHKRLPYNGTTTPYAVDNVMHGGPAVAGDIRTGSWAFMILPFIGQDAIFKNKRNDRGVPIYMCPGRNRPDHCAGEGGPGAWTDYFLNPFLNDPNGAFDVPDTKLKLEQITDGAHLTVLVGHGQINPDDYGSTDVTPGFTDIIFNGGSPGLCRPNKQVRNARDSTESRPGDWGSPFHYGSLMAMGDGGVNFCRHYEGEQGTISNGKSTGHVITNGHDFGGLGPSLTPHGHEPLLLGDF